MGLTKPLAGRIHLMRSGKSYLAAHRPTWWAEHLDPTCPHCSTGEENFSHAILSCLPRAWAKSRFLPGITSLEQDSLIWYSTTLTVALAKFIKATATGSLISSPYWGPTPQPSKQPPSASGETPLLLTRGPSSTRLPPPGVPHFEALVLFVFVFASSAWHSPFELFESEIV